MIENITNKREASEINGIVVRNCYDIATRQNVLQELLDAGFIREGAVDIIKAEVHILEGMKLYAEYVSGITDYGSIVSLMAEVTKKQRGAIRFGRDIVE